MNKENPKKLKKYLFLISIIFCVASFSHILYNYLFENSKIIPIKGGIISEGMIGKVPSLNPLKKLSGNNEYILRLLYRSMLKYDIDQKKVLGDITSCDISSLVNIECIINDGAMWSDGEKIKAEDIKATYDLIKETNSNPTIASLLDGVEIVTKGEDEIIFQNEKKDINFLNVFFQPIISKKTVNKISMDEIKGDLPYKGDIYSGEYILKGVKPDENIGTTKIILDKNEKFGKSNISRIDIYVFPDEVSLQNNIKVVNVFNDEQNAFGDSIPRLESHRYNLNQYLSLFINIEKIKNKNLRTFIFNEINRKNLINALGKINYSAVSNPYMTNTDLKKEPENKNLESVMSSIGYKKKSFLIKDLKDKALKKFNEGKKKDNKKETPKKEEKNDKKETKKLDRSEGIKRYQVDSITIKSPDFVDKYNFITKDNFKLVGKTLGKKVEEVYINDKKLKEFSLGNTNFYYRLKQSYDNIKEGENNYKIYFVINGKKELQEEINFLYYKDREKLDSEKAKFIENLYIKEEEKIKKDAEAKEQKEKQKLEEDIKISEKKLEIPKKELEKLEALNDKLFYDKNLEPYSLTLVYLDSRKDFEETAKFIQTSLKEIGITVKVKALSKKSFGEHVKEKKYDMILGGIDLGYFKSNIFPYFHSGQVDIGFNLSGIRKPSLDLLLEEAKENIYNKEKTDRLKNKILTILKEEQVVKTLYSPKMNLLIDKNIKLAKKLNSLASSSIRSEIIKTSYKKQEQILSLEGKNISGFFVYIFKKLYE